MECHITQEAQRQKEFYDSTTKSRIFNVGDTVCLHVRTAGKLDARWEGGWTVKKVLSPVNVAVEHATTARTWVVHVNRLQQRIVRGVAEAVNSMIKMVVYRLLTGKHLALNTSSSTRAVS